MRVSALVLGKNRSVIVSFFIFNDCMFQLVIDGESKKKKQFKLLNLSNGHTYTVVNDTFFKYSFKLKEKGVILMSLKEDCFFNFKGRYYITSDKLKKNSYLLTHAKNDNKYSDCEFFNIIKMKNNQYDIGVEQENLLLSIFSFSALYLIDTTCSKWENDFIE